MPIRNKDIELVKSLYDGVEFNLVNRRLTLVGADGIAVIHDDPARNGGLAVVKEGKIDKLCKVNLINNQYQDENGQKVKLRGWVHAILRPVSTAASSEYIPPEGEKTSI